MQREAFRTGVVEVPVKRVELHTETEGQAQFRRASHDVSVGGAEIPEIIRVHRIKEVGKRNAAFHSEGKRLRAGRSSHCQKDQPGSHTHDYEPRGAQVSESRAASILGITMPNSNPLALVTGASSGIGEAFARRLAADGYRLILVARRRDRLDALAAALGDAEVVPADLSGASGLELVVERIQAAPDLDLLVNNAGFGSMGRFFEIGGDSQDRMHRLHVIATMRLTHAALRGMVARGRGGVINVSSVAAFGQNPGSVSYCATKAWMNSFTEGLDMELKSAGSPVKVQALCPGFTTTEFQDVIGMDRRRIPARMWMRADDVVDASLKGLAEDKVIVVPGLLYKIIRRLQAWTPRPIRVAVTLRFWRAAEAHKSHS